MHPIHAEWLLKLPHSYPCQSDILKSFLSVFNPQKAAPGIMFKVRFLRLHHKHMNDLSVNPTVSFFQSEINFLVFTWTTLKDFLKYVVTN